MFIRFVPPKATAFNRTTLELKSRCILDTKIHHLSFNRTTLELKYIYTDSRYVADAINKKWIFGWVKNDFAKVKNPDLWQRFYALMKTYQPTFHWVKGHAGHAENELCDKLATEAIKQEHLKTDEGFEQTAGLFSGS